MLQEEGEGGALSRSTASGPGLTPEVPARLGPHTLPDPLAGPDTQLGESGGPPHPLAPALILLRPCLGEGPRLCLVWARGMETTCRLCPRAACLPGSEQRAGMAHIRAATALPAWDPCRLPVAPGPAQHAADGAPSSPGGLGALQAEQIHAYGSPGPGPEGGPRRAPECEGLEGRPGTWASFAQKSPGAQGICTSQGRNRVRF